MGNMYLNRVSTIEDANNYLISKGIICDAYREDLR